MKRENLTIVELHGQYYARWRSEEKRINKHGEEVRKECFEPTGVEVPTKGSPSEKIEAAKALAKKVGIHLKEVRGPNPPPAAIQEERLKQFALEGALLSDHSFKNCIPPFLIDYSKSNRRYNEPASTCAVWKIYRSLEATADGLGTDADIHPMLIPTHRLQTVLGGLPGQQGPNAIILRLFYKHLVEKGLVLRAFNPAALVKVKMVESMPHVAFTQLEVQRGLVSMGNLKNGDQWQILTLEGVYTSMRLGTACRVQLRPLNFERPQKPGKCAYLDTNAWVVEYFDTKGKKWVVEKLDPVFIEWLVPYIAVQKLGPGDYLLPAFARLKLSPSTKWQHLMEKSGTKMRYVQYNSKKYCVTGYHALRVSLDAWLKENEAVALTQAQIAEGGLKHGEKVHEKHYNSGVPNVAEQDRINEARPKFLPGNTDLNVRLFELRAEIQKTLVGYQSLLEREQALIKKIGEKNHAKETN